jgi:hypothetical protein
VFELNAFLECWCAIRLPATTSKAPRRTENINAIVQIIRHARPSRRARTNPRAAITNVKTQSGKSAGGTLSEEHTRKNTNKYTTKSIRKKNRLFMMGLCIKAVVFLARSFVENYHNVGGRVTLCAPSSDCWGANI